MCPYMCSKTERDGCQVWKCPLVSELGQGTTWLQNNTRQAVLYMSSSDHTIPIKFTEDIQSVLKTHGAFKT